jgi:hypothetical protein
MGPLTIKAVDAAGNQYEVYIARLGADTATLSVSEWAPGVSAPEDDPETDNTYDIGGIKVAGGGGGSIVVTCETSSFFGTPKITITLSGAAVSLVVSHVLFAPTPLTLPLDAATVAEAKAWLVAAKFPSA